MSNEPPLVSPLPGLNSRASLAADAIREAILQGTLSPGTELVERNLAAMFGISKTPVREALISLARSGLITMVPNRGATVRVLDAAAVEAVYEMRLLLEPHAVRSATSLMSAEALDQAEDAMRAAEKAIERGEHAKLTLVNRGFHRLLYSHCGNPLIVSALDDLQDQLALVAVSVLWREDSPTWTPEFREHKAILEAVERRDAAAAGKLMTEHIERSMRNVQVDVSASR
jgi:DNA-binding GntR family transcriptional regulator